MQGNAGARAHAVLDPGGDLGEAVPGGVAGGGGEAHGAEPRIASLLVGQFGQQATCDGDAILPLMQTGGVGVERIFPIHAPVIEKIELVRKGEVRRAKLYYLRDLRGKAAKIRERRSTGDLETIYAADDVAASSAPQVEEIAEVRTEEVVAEEATPETAEKTEA